MTKEQVERIIDEALSAKSRGEGTVPLFVNETLALAMQALKSFDPPSGMRSDSPEALNEESKKDEG